MIARLLPWVLAAACVTPVAAEVIVPTRDDQVIETLPSAAGRRAEREARRQLAAQPGDAALAVDLARRHLQRARELGDPRFAGQALAALGHWPDAATAPADVLLLQATLLQFLHRFDDAVQALEVLVQREPRHAQGWLTLATIRRVQGRYAESDVACGQLQAAGADLHASACRAENDALRGRFATARAVFDRLLAAPRVDAPTRAWLLTTRAELEVRAGDGPLAERAYRAALAAAPDDYTRLSFADVLIEQGRFAEAIDVLNGAARTDAVLLRRAHAGARIASSPAAADAAELRDRIAAANRRPDAQAVHAREQAMFALWIDADPARALSLSRANVRLQREPIDLILLARSARAAGDGPAQREAAQLVAGVGLRDARLHAAP